jgi:hypothetical protein
MCRQEWQDTVYAQSRITLITRMIVPSPIPNPVGEWKARIASIVLMIDSSTAA